MLSSTPKSSSTPVRIAKNTAYLYVKILVSLCFTVFTTRIVLSSLGATDYGIWGVLGSTIAMLGFLNASMSASTQRFMNYYEGRGNVTEKIKIYNSAVIIHIVIALFIGVIFFMIEGVMFNGLIKIPIERIMVAKWVYRIIILSTMVSIVTVPYNAVVNSHEDLLYFSVVGIIDVFLKFLLALYVQVTIFDKLIVYGLTVLSVTILSFFLMYVYCKRKYVECRFHPSNYFDKTLVKEMFFFGGWNLVGTSSTMISNYGIGIVINRFFGTVINATNSVCTQFTGYMQLLSTNLMKAVNPVIVKSEGSGNRKKMFETTFLSCKLSFLAYLLIGIPFFIECNYILNLWLKEVPPFCLQFCQLACILKVIEQLTVPLSTSISAVGKIKQYNIVTAIIHICQILLVIFFFAMGLESYFCVVAMIVAAVLTSLYKIIYCQRNLSMNIVPFLNIIIRSIFHLVICMVPGFIIIFMPESFARFIMIAGLALILNVVSGYYIVFNSAEREMIFVIFKRMRNKAFKHKY